MLSRTPIPPNAIARLGDWLLARATSLYGAQAALIGALLFGIYILSTATVAIIKPDANWDMLPYLAVAEEAQISDPQQLHDFAYGTVKAAVSEHDFRLLTEDDGFRSHMYANAKDFVSLLPMYRVKFFYAEILSGLSHAMSPVTAMRVVSAVSVLLFGAFVLLWLNAAGALALAPLFVGLLMMTEFGYSARASTPDLLCSALSLGGCYAFYRQREWLTATLLFVAFLVRPDNIIPIAVLATLLLVWRVRSPGLLAAVALSVAGYVGISSWAGHSGWWPHLYFSSVEQQLNMDSFHPAFSPIIYAKAFARSLLYATWYNSWVGAIVVALGLWAFFSRLGYRFDRRAGVLFAALILGTAAKFVVFPIQDTRIYFPAIVPLFLILVPFMMAMWNEADRNSQQKTGGKMLAGRGV